MDGESAPTGPDLEDMVTRAELQLATEAVELGNLRLVERRIGGVEQRARVGHRLIEEKREELVSEVVVGADVPPVGGAPAEAFEEPDAHPQNRREKPVSHPLRELGGVEVADDDADRQHEVVEVVDPPPSGEEAAPEATASPGGDGGPCRWRPHGDLGDRQTVDRLAEHLALATLRYRERSVVERTEQAGDERPGHPVPQAAATCRLASLGDDRRSAGGLRDRAREDRITVAGHSPT